jgi:hypothetical protein
MPEGDHHGPVFDIRRGAVFERGRVAKSAPDGADNKTSHCRNEGKQNPLAQGKSRRGLASVSFRTYRGWSVVHRAILPARKHPRNANQP